MTFEHETEITPSTLGRLERLDARTAWKHEARDFTPWLLQHVSLLADAMGITIDQVDREIAVGSFNVDLMGRIAGSDQVIIVENQLEETNHRHLGQLVTYAAGLDAAYIVWLTPEFRDEHRRALDWLNEITREGVSFFGVELELVRVVQPDGTRSAPAPNFKLVAQPNDWQKLTRNSDIARSGIGQDDSPGRLGAAYHEFFTDLLRRFEQLQPPITSGRRVGYGHAHAFSSGRSRIWYSVAFAAEAQFHIELYLGLSDVAANQELFNQLYEQKAQIEREIGEELVWETVENRKRISIYAYRNGRITDDPEHLEQLKRFALERFPGFRRAFEPRIKRIPWPASRPGAASPNGHLDDEDESLDR